MKYLKKQPIEYYSYRKHKDLYLKKAEEIIKSINECTCMHPTLEELYNHPIIKEEESKFRYTNGRRRTYSKKTLLLWLSEVDKRKRKFTRGRAPNQ